MKHRDGRIEVICGSMFSGKTEELIRRVRRAQIARQRVQVFKPSLDNRSPENHVKSHTGQHFEALPVENSGRILELVSEDVTVVAVDEAQFFDDGLISVANELADRGIRVIIAGLDMDFRGEPFGPMPILMACAEDVTKLHAICMVCGDEASRSQRIIDGRPANYDDPVIMIGADEVYEARCRRHHQVPGRPGRS